MAADERASVTNARGATGAIGLDIGGANTKAARLYRSERGDRWRHASRPLAVWRDPQRLPEAIRAVVAALGPAPAPTIGITMTAELCDVFRTKREGVGFVLDAVEHALADHELVVLTTGSALVAPAIARGQPLAVAAANWVATALRVAVRHPDALVLDIGSTTADVLPIVDGRLATDAATDLDRLVASQLVYTGTTRTNVAAIAPRVPLRGRWCPVASEQFAVSGDVHLILGQLASGDDHWPTPDGREVTVQAARERVARLVCADVEQLEVVEIDVIAAYVADRQLRQLVGAARRVSATLARDAPVVCLGSGAWLARQVAAALERDAVDGVPEWGAAGSEIAPASALAELVAERAIASC